MLKIQDLYLLADTNNTSNQNDIPVTIQHFLDLYRFKPFFAITLKNYLRLPLLFTARVAPPERVLAFERTFAFASVRL